MTREERKLAIERHAAGFDEVERSFDGFPESGLTLRAFPGKWSAAEIGRYTPEIWLEIYAAHAHGHAAQILRLKQALTP